MSVYNTLPSTFSFLNRSHSELSKEFDSIPNKPFIDEQEARNSSEHSIGNEPARSHSNRFPTVIANDRTRVKLSFEGYSSNYINANHCLNRRVIVAQEPMNHGENGYYGHHIDFYKMLWENHCNAIAMFTDKTSTESCQYLSPDYDDELTFNEIHPFSIETAEVSEVSQPLKELGIKATRVTIWREGTLAGLSLTHYHFPNWKAGSGTTAKVVAVLAKTLLEAIKPLEGEKPVIHCRTGIGPSGTLAAVMGAYAKIQKSYSEKIFVKETPYFPHTLIKDEVTALRSERRGCVSTVEEYQTVYDALKILVQEGYEIRGY